MSIHQDRTYRKLFDSRRWHHFTIKYHEIDICIAIPHQEFTSDMPHYCQTMIEQQRNLLDRYLRTDPDYLNALLPYRARMNAPKMLKDMEKIGFITGIGPMSAVAGAFARFIGQSLQQRFNISELIVENGGDIYLSLNSPIDIAIYAGHSPLTNRIGLTIPVLSTPIGICTSAGTVGPSLSFGSADAAMIVCKDVLLADSYATYFANCIHTSTDLEPTMNKITKIDAILGAILVKEDNMAISGIFDLKLFNTENNDTN